MKTDRKNLGTTEAQKAAEDKAAFKALVSSLRGSMSWLNITVDSYLADKYAETDAENARFAEED